MDKSLKLHVMENNCSQSLCGVNRMDKWRSDVRRREGVSESLSDRVNRKVSKWLRHV